LCPRNTRSLLKDDRVGIVPVCRLAVDGVDGTTRSHSERRPCRRVILRGIREDWYSVLIKPILASIVGSTVVKAPHRRAVPGVVSRIGQTERIAGASEALAGERKVVIHVTVLAEAVIIRRSLHRERVRHHVTLSVLVAESCVRTHPELVVVVRRNTGVGWAERRPEVEEVRPSPLGIEAVLQFVCDGLCVLLALIEAIQLYGYACPVVVSVFSVFAQRHRVRAVVRGEHEVVRRVHHSRVWNLQPLPRVVLGTEGGGKQS